MHTTSRKVIVMPVRF